MAITQKEKDIHALKQTLLYMQKSVDWLSEVSFIGTLSLDQGVKSINSLKELIKQLEESDDV